MRKLILSSSAAALCALATGCATGKSPLTGMLYTDVSAPEAATSNANSPKMGTASATSILGAVATGDASIRAAAANGQITKIHHVDYHTRSIMGFWAKYTVTVYGE